MSGQTLPKTLLKYLGQFLLAFGPMLTMHWSLLDLVHPGVVANQALSLGWGWLSVAGTKEQVELKLRIGLSIVGLMLAFTVDFWDTYTPLKRIGDFRRLYLNEKKDKWRESLGAGIRFNIMHAKRLWYPPFIRVFVWTWNDGFDPPHHGDANLRLNEFQGVCGLALRSGQPKFVELAQVDLQALTIRQRLALCLKFRLAPWQLRKTANLRAVLSVPLFVEIKSAESRRFKPVGVINIDAVTDDAAAILKAKANALSDFFVDEGKILALLG